MYNSGGNHTNEFLDIKKTLEVRVLIVIDLYYYYLFFNFSSDFLRSDA